jgi:hypothetical protein
MRSNKKAVHGPAVGTKVDLRQWGNEGMAKNVDCGTKQRLMTSTRLFSSLGLIASLPIAQLAVFVPRLNVKRPSLRNCDARKKSKRQKCRGVSAEKGTEI